MEKTAGMVIQLSRRDYEKAERHAQLLHHKSIADGRTPAASMSKQFMEDDMLTARTIGIAAEIAAAMFLGVEWVPLVDSFTNEPDIPGWDVRCVLGPKRNLIFRPNDSMDRKWILLEYMEDRKFKVLGWIHGEEARKVGSWTDFGKTGRPKVLLVKQGDLHKEFED